MSCGDPQNFGGSFGPQPCPTCGTCPTCGRGTRFPGYPYVMPLINPIPGTTGQPAYPQNPVITC